ncbi:unnamed protein product [Timema podura]|uniref:Hpc2-related domain-containing protein n=1 Tax=Timema podura TaxID=61482 RepID=A0ABN7NLN8_TIMPD|nr:unnamed protein product [Timema podura]
MDIQIHLCRDQGLNPEPPAQMSDTLPLDHRVTLKLEVKRTSLTSISSNKKEKKSKHQSKTVRFFLTLPESNEEACPEFNYSELLKSVERKQKNKDNNQVNGLDPLAEDDDEHLKQIARQFEQKYGASGAKKKHGRLEDYVDLGAGYDESDPFIDNTDAYDEVVPEEMTTAHGGFYINCGALEFKEVEEQSDPDDDDKDAKPKKRIKNRSKSSLHSMLALGVCCHLVLNSTFSVFLLCIAGTNYPGGAAIARLHRLAKDEPYVNVHIAVLAAQTGVSRFTQINQHWSALAHSLLRAREHNVSSCLQSARGEEHMESLLI